MPDTTPLRNAWQMRRVAHMSEQRTDNPGGWDVEWTLGDRLRKARELAGYDAKAFAERIGVSRDTIRSYEADRYLPKRPVLLAWALATGKTVAQLLDDPTHPTAPDGLGISPTAWNERDAQVLNIYDNLPTSSATPHAA
jgi:transcriptional regulator with XRE-family HTH domain